MGRASEAVSLAKNMLELPRHPKYNTMKKSGSTRYGRMRLFQALNTYEMWDEMISLAGTSYLEPTDDFNEQVKRERHLGRAYFRSGKTKKGKELLASLEKRLSDQRAQQEKAGAAARAKLTGGAAKDGKKKEAGKPGDKKAKAAIRTVPRRRVTRRRRPIRTVLRKKMTRRSRSIRTVPRKRVTRRRLARPLANRPRRHHPKRNRTKRPSRRLSMRLANRLLRKSAHSRKPFTSCRLTWPCPKAPRKRPRRRWGCSRRRAEWMRRSWHLSSWLRVTRTGLRRHSAATPSGV
ncbi:MAG: hypothetical protein CM1200mP2_42230 [Planctomycetaceae bacterium]|nr:MAG: hypothetical protein CM1200mP2_42230 [Planctomycetaceae bacterium]